MPLGLTIATDNLEDTPNGQGPTVHAKSISPKGAVAKDGRMHEGDFIIAVDDVNISKATHAEAVDAILAALENGENKITFQVWRPSADASA